MSHGKNILVESAEPGIRIVKINRASVLNALNTETLLELRSVLTVLQDDLQVRAVILTGEGGKAFIAGADIAEMSAKDSREGVVFSQLGHSVAKLLEQMPKPTIAAVNGFALGGGTEMAISCDMIIASEQAVFGQPEVCLGIIAGFGATLRLSKFVGLSRAKELLFSGRRIKADEALRIGLVTRVVPAEQLIQEAISLARSFALNSRGAVAKTKKLLNEFSECVGLNYKADSEAQEFGRLFDTKDQKEGMKAFLEKRKPKFEGLE